MMKHDFVRRRRGAGHLFLMASSMMIPSLTGIAAPAQAQSGSDRTTRPYNIPAQPLGNALRDYMRQSGVQVGFPSEIGDNVTTPAVIGSFSAVEALSRLLTGTGLTYRFTGTGTAILDRAPMASGSAIQLGPVRVEGSGGAVGASTYASTTDPSATDGIASYTAAGPSSTATGLLMSRRETPQSLTVVTRQKMDDFALETLSDVLDQTPGLTVTRQGNAIKFSSRGTVMNLRTEGLRQITSGWYYVQSATYSLDDMAEIDRVEILKGSSGLINGDGGFGGTVNLLRKRPTYAFNGTIGGAVSRWNGYRADADIGGPLNGNGSVRARAVAAWRSADSFRDNEKSSNGLLYTTIDVDIAPGTSVNLGATYKHQNLRGRGSTTPIIAFTEAEEHIRLMPRSFNIGAPWAGLNQDTYSLFSTLNHRFHENWSMTLKIGREKIKMPNMILGHIDNEKIATTYQYKGIISTNDHIDLQVNGNIDLFGRKHDVIIGSGISGSRTHFERVPGPEIPLSSLGVAYDAGGVAIPRPSAATIAAWPKQREWWSTKRDYLYSAIRLHVADPLRFLVGTRLSNYRHDEQTEFWTMARREKNVLTPYAALTFDIAPDYTLYGSYTNIFEPQDNRGADGRRLDPKRGNTYEIGAKAEIVPSLVDASIAYFWMKADNEAESTGAFIPGTDVIAYRPVSGATRAGWEIEIAGEIAPGLNVQGGVAMNSSNLRTATEIPKYQSKMNASYDFKEAIFEGFKIGGGVRWQSRISVTYGRNTLEQSGYLISDLFVSKNINENALVSLNVDNMFDRKYFSGLTNFSSLHYTWGEPRIVRASIRYKL